MPATASKITMSFAAGCIALFGLAACGGGADASSAEGTAAPAAEEEQVAEETPTEEAAAGAEGGTAASWANPVTTEGELIGTIDVGDVTVDVYQVATDTATRSSVWEDPDTEEPIVKEGDDVVVLNYVITNNGAPVILNYGLVDVGLSYDTWPYMQQPSVADTTLLEQYGVNDNGVNGDSLGEDAYELGTGEQYSVGEVMLYQPGESYTIEAEVTPRDDAGERTGDSFTGELTGTLE